MELEAEPEMVEIKCSKFVKEVTNSKTLCNGLGDDDDSVDSDDGDD